MSFYYKDIKEIRALVISHRNPSSPHRDQKRITVGGRAGKDPGPRLPQESCVSSGGTWGLCVPFPLLLLVQAICLSSQVSLTSTVCLRLAQSHLPGKNTHSGSSLVSMRPAEACLCLRGCREGHHPARLPFRTFWGCSSAWGMWEAPPEKGPWPPQEIPCSPL